MTTLAVVVGLSAAPAAAQAKKKADPKAAKADPKAAPKLTPTAAAAKKEAERQGPAKLDAKGGGVAPNKDDVAKDAQADKKRDEGIDALKKIIPKFEDGNPQKADLL
ncbi:MAG TPA: hypothetical protein VGD87_12615, partial [Archangium sp.]